MARRPRAIHGLKMANSDDHSLGNFLKTRRAKLDPAAFGYPSERRRTPGLRREEVAQRANVSPTWYTWLEQGRGGTPSADVLDRIARALVLAPVEREHLFLLAHQRPPEVRYQTPAEVPPKLQCVLDSLGCCPAQVRTPAWDVVAWNRAAAVMLTDYAALPPDRRNILRIVFTDPRVRAEIVNWESEMRFVVAAFRADVARAGASVCTKALIEELSLLSPEFAAFWRDQDVRAYGDGIKHLRHPVAGLVTLEYSAFSVDGRPDLGMQVYTPSTPADRRRVEAILEADAEGRRTGLARRS